MTNVERLEFSMCTSLSKHQTQNVRFIFPVDILTKSQERCVPQNVTFGWNLCYEFWNEMEKKWMVGCAHPFLPDWIS